MSKERWWHGGPRFSGDLILPPSVTGARNTAEMVADDPEAAAEAARVYRPDRVYLTSSRDAAIMFAACQLDPWLYLAEPLGEIEEDEDYYGEWRAIQVPRARILRREKPSSRDVDLYRAVLLGPDLQAPEIS